VEPLTWLGLAATTFAASVLQAASGFGFAVMAAPLFLLFVAPGSAIQLVIIVTAVLSAAVLPGLGQAVARGLLLRLLVGSLAGLPLGLLAFRAADPRLARAVIGATILIFAVALALARRRRDAAPRLEQTAARDLAAGAVSGATTALIGMSGPPVLIYLLLAGAAPRTVRATLLAFFALCYAATLLSHVAAIGVPGPTWRIAASLVPFALLGGAAGRPLGDRLGEKAFAALALALLAATALYTLAAAMRMGSG
jgi:uncharacterized protein